MADEAFKPCSAAAESSSDPPNENAEQEDGLSSVVPEKTPKVELADLSNGDCPEPPTNGGQPDLENREDDGGEGEDGDEDEDSDDDAVCITIDKEKIDEAKSSYQNIGLNKAARQAALLEKKGKFTVDEFDQVGTIKGQPAPDFDMESVEDKPWKKPGIF